VARTPDRAPGASDEEATIYEASGVSTQIGEVRFTGVRFSFCDSTGEFDPRSGGGISENQHPTLLQLIHFLDEGPAEGFGSAAKTVTGSVFPTQTLWRRSDNSKLVQQDVVWSGAVPTTVVWRIFAADGVSVLATVTDTITYAGVFETGRTRVIT
jgi:hypothetical protein